MDLDPREQRAVLRRLKWLEENAVTLRQGEISGGELVIGGSAESIAGVRGIGGSPAADGARVAALKAGRDLLVLGALTEELVPEWTEVLGGVGFGANWANFGSGYETASYWKDPFGIVHLRGFVRRSAPGAGTTIFTLPAGYRPGAINTRPGNVSSGMAEVTTAGVVRADGSNPVDVSLTGISFQAEA